MRHEEFANGGCASDGQEVHVSKEAANNFLKMSERSWNVYENKGPL
jgi:hypothetical protein